MLPPAVAVQEKLTMTHVGVGWLDDNDETPKLVSNCCARKQRTAKGKRSKHTVKKVKGSTTFVGKLLTVAAATPLDGEPRCKALGVIRLGSDCSGYGSEFLAMKFSDLPVKTVFCSEIDPDKVVLLRRTHHVFKDEDFVLYPDITKRVNSKAPECDIFISGAPCQA